MSSSTPRTLATPMALLLCTSASCRLTLLFLRPDLHVRTKRHHDYCHHMSNLPADCTVLFVVVNGVPSVGVQIMVGSGKIETQATTANVALPSSGVAKQTSTATGSGSQHTGAAAKKSAASQTLGYNTLQANIFGLLIVTLIALAH